MTTRDICFTPAVELAAMIRDGEVSSLEVVQAVLDRIERLNPLINSYCTVVADRALDEARAADTAIVERATRVFDDLGCVVEETDFTIDSPADDYLLRSSAVYAAIRQEEVRDRSDPGYINLVDEVRDATAADYVRASMLRRDLCQRFGELMERYDLLLTPTMPVPARPIDEPGLRSQTLGWNPFCPTFNMTGQPAASVPCGFTADGLPVGLQIVGRRFDEYTVLRGSAAFEAEASWADTRPPAPFGA